jgi:hypothetical protein
LARRLAAQQPRTVIIFGTSVGGQTVTSQLEAQADDIQSHVP